MYTPAQVCEMLGLPASTLRHYAKLFEDHLSDQTGRRHRLYSERDVVVVMKVVELSKAGKPLELIGPALEVLDAPEPEGLEGSRSSLALVPGIAREIETAQTTARAALSQLASLEKAMDDRNAQLDQLAADLAYTRDLLNNLYKYSSLPWWKKLFSKPPVGKIQP